MSAFTSSPGAFLALMLLSGADLAVEPALPPCPSRLELVAEPKEPLPEVCISPGLPTTFRFHAPLPPGTTVVVKGRERFADVPTGDSSFALLPLEDVQPGERFMVTVRFADGAAPTSATFPLVVHPAWAPRQVEVFRHRRTVEDCQQENQEERVRSQQLGQELGQLQLEHGPGGLTGLFASGVLVLNDTGVLARPLKKEFTEAASNALSVDEVHSYRATMPRMEGEQRVMRVAVAMKAKNLGTLPWQAHNAALVNKVQEAAKVKVWSRSPIPPDKEDLVVVETELPEQEARETYVLKIWDESGRRLVTIGHITFP